MKSHCGDKMMLRLSHLHNGISYPGKTTFYIELGHRFPYDLQYWNCRCHIKFLTALYTGKIICLMERKAYIKYGVLDTRLWWSCYCFAFLETVNSIYKLSQLWRIN